MFFSLSCLILVVDKLLKGAHGCRLDKQDFRPPGLRPNVLSVFYFLAINFKNYEKAM